MSAASFGSSLARAVLCAAIAARVGL